MLWPCPDCILPFCSYLFVNCPCGAMSCEVKLNTLQGSVITLDILMTATVLELKSMLLEKHPCQDPIERKVLKVELLRDSSIIDDAESLDEAGLVGAESLVTVTYTRNEVEAATKNDIRTQGCFGVKIPCNLTKISQSAFQNSPQLVLLTIPESVTHIGSNAFHGCTSLASITLGGSVTYIGSNTFSGCTSLASITLGGSVTYIGSSAFRGCTSLASITLGEYVTHIGDYAFYGCTSLASIALGESVTQIGECAFSECSSLASITLGESVTQIGECAFSECSSLASITLGESVTHIGDCTFYGCTSLASIILGESVTHILNCVFQGCTSLASITLGESVTYIGDYAFYRCTSLASITLGESVTYIGKHPFYGCSSLARITIPESFKLRDILKRKLWNISPAIITIPARQGTKRVRKEWVTEQASVQNCSDANCPQIVTTCRKNMSFSVIVALWWVRRTSGFSNAHCKIELCGRYFVSNPGVKGKDVFMLMGDQYSETNIGTKWHQHVFTRCFPPFTSLPERRKTRTSPCIRFMMYHVTYLFSFAPAVEVWVSVATIFFEQCASFGVFGRHGFWGFGCPTMFHE